MIRKKLYIPATLLVALVCSFYVAYPQKSTTELFNELRKATSVKAKADICFEISRRYSSGLKIDSALYFADKIKGFSRQSNYELGTGKYYLALADALYFRSKNAESEENVLKAIEIFARHKENILLGQAYNQLAQSQYVTNKIVLSRNNYWNALSCFIPAGNTNGLFLSYYWLARSYFKTSEIDSAAFYYVKALAVAEQINDPARIHQAACMAGRSFLSLADLDKAIKYYDYGLKSLPTRTDKVGLRSFIKDYAICLALTHQFSKADSVINEVELINASLKDQYGPIITDRLKGTLEFEKKNYMPAVKYLRSANNKGAELKILNTEIKDILLLLGKAEYEVHEYDSAVIHLRSAAQMSKESRESTDEREANLLISKTFQQRGVTDSAFYYFRNYSLLKDSILSIEKQKAIIEVTTRYETKKKEQEIKTLQKETEANSYLLQLTNQQLEKQQLEDEKKSQQLDIALKQNEINKLDASQKTLSLDNAKKENEKSQAKLKLLEQEAAFQKLLALKQNEQRKILFMSITIILVLSAFVIYRYIRRKKLQNQQEVLNERLRISRELHDEVGSTLTGIAMYSHLTKEQIKAANTEEVERSLNNIQQSAGDMVNKLSDIVWLINPEKDSLQKLIERLEQYAEEMAMLKGMEVIITVSPKLTNISLPVEERRSIYLFCKEAINNAVKYSHAGLLEISMRESENKKIEILISDNGKGFDSAVLKNGNGLTNMKQRAVAMGGDYSLKTSPGEGTKISLSLKIT